MTTQAAPARSKPRIAAAVVLVILAGLASRLTGHNLPRLISKDLGDVLWVLMFFLMILLLFPRSSALLAGLAAFLLAAGFEFLKLYHAPWLDAVRGNRAMGFLLGKVFLWSNFIAYAVGALTGIVMDTLLRRR